MVEHEYAKAIYELAIEEKKEKEFREYLRLVDQSLNDNKDFLTILNTPELSKDKKKEMVKDVYKSLDDTFVNFLQVLVDHDRMSCISEIAHQYRMLHNVDQNVVVVRISSAKALTATQVKKLEKSLQEKYSDKTLDCRYSVNDELIGGIQITVNGESLDMSMKSSLEKLRESL